MNFSVVSSLGELAEAPVLGSSRVSVTLDELALFLAFHEGGVVVVSVLDLEMAFTKGFLH